MKKMFRKLLLFTLAMSMPLLTINCSNTKNKTISGTAQGPGIGGESGTAGDSGTAQGPGDRNVQDPGDRNVQDLGDGNVQDPGDGNVQGSLRPPVPAKFNAPDKPVDDLEALFFDPNSNLSRILTGGTNADILGVGGSKVSYANAITALGNFRDKLKALKDATSTTVKGNKIFDSNDNAETTDGTGNRSNSADKTKIEGVIGKFKTKMTGANSFQAELDDDIPDEKTTFVAIINEITNHIITIASSENWNITNYTRTQLAVVNEPSKTSYKVADGKITAVTDLLLSGTVLGKVFGDHSKLVTSASSNEKVTTSSFTGALSTLKDKLEKLRTASTGSQQNIFYPNIHGYNSRKKPLIQPTRVKIEVK